MHLSQTLLFLSALVSVCFCTACEKQMWLYLQIFFLPSCMCRSTVHVCGFIVGMCIGRGRGVSLRSVPACSGNGCFFH